MPTKDVQVLEHLFSAEIPMNETETDKILNIGNFVWKLNVCTLTSNYVSYMLHIIDISYIFIIGLPKENISHN